MDLSGFKGKTEHEEKTFEKFLLAIFGRQYQLMNVAELTTLMEIARYSYYQALPAVSPTVHTAALKNFSFWSAMIRDPWSVLVAGKTLPNEVLFKDSFVICLGPWSNPAHSKLVDKDLLDPATTTATHSKMCFTVMQDYQAILLHIGRNRPPQESSRSSTSKTQILDPVSNLLMQRLKLWSISSSGCKMNMLVFYRRFHERIQGTYRSSAIRMTAFPILNSGL
jgi:hypothetical protein